MSNEQQEVLDGLKRTIEKAYQAGKEDAVRDGAIVYSNELGTLLHCAIGYAFGRKTYMTTLVPELVRRYWSHLHTGAQATLHRNLKSDIDVYDRTERKIGDDCDDRSWRYLLEWMEEQQTKVIAL